MNAETEIQKLQKKDYDEWNKFVKNDKNSTIFHTIEWKQVLEETFNYKPDYVIVKNQDETIGVCPAFLVKTLFGKVIVSQPLFEYGGLIVKDGYNEAYEKILDYYVEKAKEKRVKYVEIKPLPSEFEKLEKSKFIKQFKAYSYYIDVKGKDFEKDIWLGLYTKKSRVRNSVKKAISSGIKIASDKNVDVYYGLYLETMGKLGAPPFPKSLFKNIEKYVKEARFTFAFLGEKYIAALMSFLYNKRNLMVGLVSDERYQHYRANDLLYNEQIEHATKNGFEIVDFGRTQPNSSHERYKKKWGSTQVDLYSYVYSLSGKQDVDPYKHYLFFSNITKRVPWVFTKTRLGPYLSKKFP